MAMYDNYAQMEKFSAQTVGLAAAQYHPPTARQQLEQKMAMIQSEAQRVQAALDALDAHPELETFTETLKGALR